VSEKSRNRKEEGNTNACELSTLKRERKSCRNQDDRIRKVALEYELACAKAAKLPRFRLAQSARIRSLEKEKERKYSPESA
jgi:hypothetical protein